MKKFIAVVIALIAGYLLLDYVIFHTNMYINLNPSQVITTISKADTDTIYVNKGTGFEPFTVKGVDMGSGVPGEWSTDFSIKKNTYLTWFKQIQEMGANTIRIYTVQNSDFYEAFYQFNKNNPEPLYIIHGVWVNDYIQNSIRDAYSDEFYKTFKQNCITMINVIHGKCKLNIGEMASAGSGTYNRDISPWVIGYILGVEWEDGTVAFTDERYKNNPNYCGYKGEYLYTTDDVTPFETMLAKVGDSTIEYETKRYGVQKLVAFSNWPTTDPFEYPEHINKLFEKCGRVNVEHIKTTEKFISGQFASYHVYPYYPDYLSLLSDWSFIGLENTSDYINQSGQYNTYLAYLTALTKFHTMPVVISEFGVSTGRGIAQIDTNTGRNQGHMSEGDQGAALKSMYEDIMEAGCAGGCIFTWQDEWFKRTWNTMYAIDMKRTPYWSDYQTNEQYFGLLSFDPGKDKCVSYVDGDLSEWTDADIVSENDGMTLYMKTDERFVYFRIHKEDLDFINDTLYIPIDVTPKSGSTWCKNYGLLFDKAVDFIIKIHGYDDSKIVVQEYYNPLRANYGQEVFGVDSYFIENLKEVDSPVFEDIKLILKTDKYESQQNTLNERAETFPTGLLLYGNANPTSKNFNSLADFISTEKDIEVKIPWQMLNFCDPSRNEIHDDYYNFKNYGVAYCNISGINVGVASNDTVSRIGMDFVKLKGWNNNVTYHERLKSSYYVMQALWRDGYGD